MALQGGKNKTSTARTELPVDLARHVFGVSLECSRIEKETQASASLESVAAVRKVGSAADKTVLLLTITGSAEAVRLAQQIVENRARRALKKMEVDLVQNSLRPKRSSSIDHEITPVEASLIGTSSTGRQTKKKILYTREEMLACLQSPESWKRPKGLPEGNLLFLAGNF